MALTTDTSIFGARGVSDIGLFNSAVAFKRTIDMAVANLAKDTNYEILPLPKSFVATGVSVQETTKASAAAALTLKTKNGETNIGSAVSVGGSTLANTFAVADADATEVKGVVPVMDGDVLCIAASAALTEGVVTITVYGVLPNADALTNGVTIPALRVLPTPTGVDGNPVDNVSKGQMDPRIYAGT